MVRCEGPMLRVGPPDLGLSDRTPDLGLDRRTPHPRPVGPLCLLLLLQRLLLRQAVQRAQPPHKIDRVDADDGS